MDVGKLFSWKGRIRRTDFWGVYLISNVVQIVFGIVNGFWILRAIDIWNNDPYADVNQLEDRFATGSTLLSIVLFVIWLVISWITFVAAIKRWHDREKSGWWTLIALIFPIGTIWSWVELGALEGTDGPNRYGAPNSGSPFGAVPKGSVPPTSLTSGAPQAGWALPPGQPPAAAPNPAAVARPVAPRQNPAPAPLHAVCPQCGKPNTPPSFFCAWCGYSLRK